MPRKIVTMFCLMVIVAISFAGCDSTPPIKSETEIIEDISANGYYAETFSSYTITEVQIEKRQTDVKNNIDKIYATLTIIDKDESVEGHVDMLIEYGLYNEGWLMNTSELYDGANGGYNIVPLRGLNLTDEEVFWEAGAFIGENWENFNIYSHDSDLEAGVETYKITATEHHKYVATTIDGTLSYHFLSDSGSWVPYFETNSYEDIWDIAGTYTYKLGNNIIEVEISENFFQGDYPRLVRGQTLFSTSSITLGDFLGSQAGYYKIRAALGSGYSVSFADGIDYYSFQYCIGRDSSSEYSALFIGKDMLAIYFWGDCNVSDYNRQVVIGLRELEKSE